MVTEGRLQIVSPSELAALDAELTPIARFVMDRL
jgi:hypothetical protein